MSPRDSTERRGIHVQKPKADIYTAMLGLSLAAVLFAILFLVLEMRAYEFKTSPTGSLPPAQMRQLEPVGLAYRADSDATLAPMA